MANRKEQISSYLPERQTYKNYYEPFLGGGAVFFISSHMQRYGRDINSEVIATYKCVKDYLPSPN